MVHIHNGILLSHKKEHIWVSSNEVDETAVYYIQWSKSERQIPYFTTYIWNLERWYQWSYVQVSKGDTDVKNRLLDSEGEGEGGMIWEKSIETYILPCVKQMTSASVTHEAGHSKPCSGTTWRDGVGRQVGGWSGWVTHACGRFILIYGKNHHNIVKQLSSNLNKFF